MYLIEKKDNIQASLELDLLSCALVFKHAIPYHAIPPLCLPAFFSSEDTSAFWSDKRVGFLHIALVA